MLEKELAPFFAGDLGSWAVQAIPGVGPVLAAIFVAEIGDISRFKSARHLCSWAGLTPTHHESDETVRRGHITKQGSRIVRWAAVEAVAHQRSDTPIRLHHRRVGERRASRSGVWRPPANFSSSSTTACATARSVAWLRRGENRDGRSPVRARRISWLLRVSEAAPLIEPTGLRPNHSTPPCRGEQINGTRVPGLPSQHCWHWSRTATCPRTWGRPGSPDGLRIT